MVLDRFPFVIAQKHGNTLTHKDAHKDSDKYPIVAFDKNATLKTQNLKIHCAPHLIHVSQGDGSCPPF